MFLEKTPPRNIQVIYLVVLTRSSILAESSGVLLPAMIRRLNGDPSVCITTGGFSSILIPIKSKKPPAYFWSTLQPLSTLQQKFPSRTVVSAMLKRCGRSLDAAFLGRIRLVQAFACRPPCFDCRLVKLVPPFLPPKSPLGSFKRNDPSFAPRPANRAQPPLLKLPAFHEKMLMLTG